MANFGKFRFVGDDGKGKILISSPGKVILFGEHAVVHDKTAIAAALDKRTFLSIDPSSTGNFDKKIRLELHLKNFQSVLTFDIDLDKLSKYSVNTVDINPDLLLLAKSTVDSCGNAMESARNASAAFLYLFLALALTTGAVRNETANFLLVQVYSHLPVGAGLGSSASFSVCAATSLLLHFNLLHIDSLHDSATLVNSYAFLAEKILHGNPSGLDNTLCVYGGTMAYQKKGQSRKLHLKPLDFILSNTRQPRETKLLVQKVADNYSKMPLVLSGIFDSIDGICGTFQESLKVEELKIAEFYSKGFYDTMTDLLRINQNHLNSMGVGHHKIDEICHHMKLRFNLESKLTGAGGGGCVITLVDPYSLPCSFQELKNHLKDTKGERELVSVGGKGVAIHCAPLDFDITDYSHGEEENNVIYLASSS